MSRQMVPPLTGPGLAPGLLTAYVSHEKPSPPPSQSLTVENASSKASTLSHDDWNSHRQNIRQLYLEQNLNLGEVVHEMITKHEFVATQRMYKAQFAKWGWSKYNSKRSRRDINSGKAIETSTGKSCTRVKKDRTYPPFLSDDGAYSPTVSSTHASPEAQTPIKTDATGADDVLDQVLDPKPEIRQLPLGQQEPSSLTNMRLVHANDSSRHLHTILLDIQSHVYSFHTTSCDWQMTSKTGLMNTYDYSYYDSFRVAMDSFRRNDHQHGGQVLRQVFLEVEKSIEADYATTFYSFFIDLPDLFLQFGRTDILQILLQHVTRLSNAILKSKIVGQGLASLCDLVGEEPAILSHCVTSASTLWTLLLEELRGPLDRSTLLAKRNNLRHTSISRTAGAGDIQYRHESLPQLQQRKSSLRTRIQELVDGYDHILEEIRVKHGIHSDPTLHFEDVTLLLEYNFGTYLPHFERRNLELIAKITTKYSTKTYDAISRKPSETPETRPLTTWDILDRNIRSNCYERLATYYSIHGDSGRADQCRYDSLEGWKGRYWHYEVESELIAQQRFFEAETLRRCRLESQYFCNLPDNDRLQRG